MDIFKPAEPQSPWDACHLIASATTANIDFLILRNNFPGDQLLGRTWKSLGIQRREMFGNYGKVRRKLVDVSALQ